MTKLQTHDFEQQLTGMRSALLAQIAEQRGGTISRVEVAADHFGHPEEAGAQLASERELEFALGERELAELAAIDAALARLAAGTFGECTDCGKHIPPARLHASPEALRCIHCQEKEEHQHPV
ncbi:MAG TPA: TraR/DksA family transcriptional regulator [Rhodoferax sp.]|nr:TraR/DksA family transcriptional regulator [Rhodoferax sp.]HNV58804.1 TraR/DksA family transcriptional regulator [Rhodoferax sp.]HPW29305.1 TraR/DksA family transcriptional regulator [Rhodoferax sp.]